MTFEAYVILLGHAREFNNREDIAKRCLAIANDASFPTDYEDVYNHLFANDDYIICILRNSESEIMGFAVFDNLKDLNTLYLHGIVLHPEVQGKGYSKDMIGIAIDYTNPKYLCARTHNPRMFETISSFALRAKQFWPNASDEIPERIYRIVLANKFTGITDEFLICRNAYPDEKIKQTYRNPEISKIFSRLKTTDAQVVVARLK